MPLLARTVTTPLFVDVRRGAIAELGRILPDRRISGGGQVAVVVGPGQGERIADLLRPSLGAAGLFAVAGGTVQAAHDLGAKLRARPYDAVVGIGGGKTIDTAKYAATRYGLPMVSVATSLAHDGIASPVSILDHEAGRGSYGVHIPIAVVVDLARTVHGEPIDGLAVSLARSGAEAILNHPGGLADDDFLTTLADGLVMSGVAMTVCGSTRPCSGRKSVPGLRRYPAVNLSGCRRRLSRPASVIRP